jgi:hypothetical protein
VPDAKVTVHACAGVVGWVATVTAYGLPLAILAVKVNGPFVAIGRSFAPLFRRTRLAPGASPVTLPPTVKELVTQVTATLATFDPPTVPVAFAIVQTWVGEPGWAATVTA